MNGHVPGFRQSVFRLFEIAAEGACGIDREERIVAWNAAAERILGMSAHEVRNRYCFEVFAGTDESGCRICQHRCRAIAAAQRGESIPTRDVCVRDKAGQPVWLSMSSFGVPTRPGEAVTLIHVFRDVTRQKALLLDLERVYSESRGIGPDSPRGLSSGTACKGNLTLREREVLGLLAAGVTTGVLAETLVISPSTARHHISNILAKLGAHSRLEAASLALRNGWL